MLNKDTNSVIRHRSYLNHVWMSGLIAFSLCLLRGPAEGFVYDASHYWSGAYSIVAFQSPYDAGWLAVRGVLSSLVYIPATTASLLVGTWLDGYAVLAQNSAAIAFLGSFLIPRTVTVLGVRETTIPKVIWLSSIFTTVVFSGFAPYPLMDLWALVALFLGTYFLLKKSIQTQILGWFLLGATVNLRPAYLAPVFLMLLLLFVADLKRPYKFFLTATTGILLALSPQMVLNLVIHGIPLPWPIDMSNIGSTQSMFASFVVRYDTVPFDDSRSAAQFFCSPEMGLALSDGAPTDSLGVMNAFLSNFPTSAQFVIEKISSTFMWTWETPYLSSTSDSSGPLALVLAGIFGLGLVGLFLNTQPFGKQIENKSAWMLIVIFLAIFGTLMFSTTESRFAAPLVVILLVGSLLLFSRLLQNKSFVSSIIHLLVAFSIGGALFLLGTGGLQHPAPPGLVSPEICSTASSEEDTNGF